MMIFLSSHLHIFNIKFQSFSNAQLPYQDITSAPNHENGKTPVYNYNYNYVHDYYIDILERQQNGSHDSFGAVEIFLQKLLGLRSPKWDWYAYIQ